MSVMDDAMAKLATAVEAAKAKAVEDFKATLPPPVDEAAIAANQEAADAGMITNFANQLNPPAEGS